jgi:hypothetical protein
LPAPKIRQIVRAKASEIGKYAGKALDKPTYQEKLAQTLFPRPPRPQGAFPAGAADWHGDGLLTRFLPSPNNNTIDAALFHQFH